MGDGPDGSSTAAQRAQPESEPPQRGILKRIFGTKATAAAGLEVAAANHPDLPRVEHQTLMKTLGRVRVRDAAIPKADIVAVPETFTKDQLVTVFRETGFTRLPVFNGTLDTPLGMIHLKDFALQHGFNGNGGEAFSLTGMLRPLLYVPPSMSLGVLLQKMQTERRHMALVIDEYGGVDGLLTIEDLIEQVVGEIEDEHDTEEDQFWTTEKPGQYLVLSKTPLDEFEEEIGLSLTDSEEIDEEEIDTLGGLVFVLCGRVPARGEIVPHPDGHEIVVVDADPRRIKRLRVRLKTDG